MDNLPLDVDNTPDSSPSQYEKVLGFLKKALVYGIGTVGSGTIVHRFRDDMLSSLEKRIVSDEYSDRFKEMLLDLHTLLVSSWSDPALLGFLITSSYILYINRHNNNHDQQYKLYAVLAGLPLVLPAMAISTARDRYDSFHDFVYSGQFAFYGVLLLVCGIISDVTLSKSKDPPPVRML